LQLLGRLDVAIPEIVAEGERDHWPYLVITRLDGVLGSTAWRAVPEDQKDIILRQIGETIAQIQDAPLGPLAEIEPKWPQFIKTQIAGCRARHERLGMPQRYLDGLNDILSEASEIIPTDSRSVILTGEYIPENFLLTDTPRGWRLTGIIDFGDVMTGWGEYDLLGPSAFMTSGRPERVRSLLSGFGYSRAEMNPALAQRLLALLLLHRASDPIRHIDIADWQERAGSLRDLKRLLWPF
jgi:hygromycin-B 7''-O-kinase